MLTTNHHGQTIRTIDTPVRSLLTVAAAAGRARAGNGGELPSGQAWLKRNARVVLRCHSGEVTQEVWEAYRSAFLEASTGVPF